MTDTIFGFAKNRPLVILTLVVLVIASHRTSHTAHGQQAMPAVYNANRAASSYHAHAQQSYTAAPVAAVQPPSYTPHGLPYVPMHNPEYAHAQQSYTAASASAVQPPTYTPHGLPYPQEMFNPEYSAATYTDQNYATGRTADGIGPYDDLARLFTTQRYDDHWIDVRADFVYLYRDDAIGNTVFTTDGVTGTPVLSASDVDISGQGAAGARVTAAFDFWYSCDIEVSWMGDLHWSGAAEATSVGNSLYSIFSGYGITPPQGFVETDQAARHAIRYSSDLSNTEVNARWRWCHTTAPVTGAWILGVRYLQLKEHFQLLTQADAHIDPVLGGPRGPGEMDYRLSVINDLVGFQIGGELMAAPFKDLLIGADIEAGIFGNTSASNSHITATTLASPLIEKQEAVQTAFVGEASAMLLYRIHNELYLRGGYQVLYVQGIGTGPNNLNTSSPFTPNRPLSQSTGSHLLLHGFYGGFEWQY